MAKTTNKLAGGIEGNFGGRLMECRKRLKLTPQEFAQALELNSADLLSRFENNELLPSTPTLIRMAKQWGVDLNGLLVGTPAAGIAVEVKAIQEIKGEFRVYRNVLREHIARLQTIDGVAEGLLEKMDAAEKKATEKR